MGAFDTWVGREDLRTSLIDLELVRRWCATLDREGPDGVEVGQGFHWCLGAPDVATAGLGSDGHPRLDNPGGFLPPVPLPRRMWASSKVDFRAPLQVGDTMSRVSRIVSVTEKAGSSGQLIFVEVAHETHGPSGLSIQEIQSIVYRERPPTGNALQPPELGVERFDPSNWRWHREVAFSEALLFRYSALTFNAHRIHYDFPYATAVEGYRGLVVQGPLIATLLLDLAKRAYGDNRLRRFAFRGLSPAIAGDALHFVMRDGPEEIELGAYASDGRQVTSATAAL